jgi:hypothetical protein
MADQKRFNGAVSHEGTLNINDQLNIAGLSLVGSTAIATALLGLNPQWNLNFGGAVLQAAAGTQAASTLDVLTPANTMLRLSFALEKVASQTAAPTAAQATQVFGGTGVAGADVAIGTTASPGQTPTVTQRISRLTGGISGTVTMSAGADMASAGDETLILFTGNTFASTGILKLTLHADNELDADSTEVLVTEAEGFVNTLEREAAATDADQIIVITDTGDSTIVAGSYLYLHSGNNTDEMSLKGCLRTTGGTVAVTYAN